MSDDVWRPCGEYLLGDVAVPWQLVFLEQAHKHACLILLICSVHLFSFELPAFCIRCCTILKQVNHSACVRGASACHVPAVDDILLILTTGASSVGGARPFWRLCSAAVKCFVQVLAKKLQPHCKVVKIDTDKYPNLASRNQVQVPSPHLSAVLPFIWSLDDLQSNLLLAPIAARVPRKCSTCPSIRNMFLGFEGCAICVISKLWHIQYHCWPCWQ